MASQNRALMILGNQLFPAAELRDFRDATVYMAEDRELCTRVRHHRQKLVLFLAAMREHADNLRSKGFDVVYRPLDLDDERNYEQRLGQFLDDNGIGELLHFEIEDRFFEQRIEDFCNRRGLARRSIESPMFLTTRQQFAEYLEATKRPHMADFYRRQRRRLQVLVDGDGRPRGGRFSFDAENRRALPADTELPELPESRWTSHTEDVVALVDARFDDHPGRAADFWWPVTRRSALYWLRDFLGSRLDDFGPYQDAISRRSETAFHSVLSPLLNLGLVTPRDVLDQALAQARDREVPLQSLEGFVRQVIGWREFVRGIYRHYDEEQQGANFWDHHRSLRPAWYSGDTGIPPLDDAIRSALRLGWTHHINRLMVIGNLMNLCEIEPRQVHDWFMETHVDSSEWVMGPNVYGMALYADGGIFATKPYICGSNYLLKMSDYERGDWCDTVDGLYWRFIDKHREFFAGNPRLSMTVRTLDRLATGRRQRIFDAAERFLERHTA